MHASRCPSCGAAHPLAAPAKDGTMTCRYCGTTARPAASGEVAQLVDQLCAKAAATPAAADFADSVTRALRQGMLASPWLGAASFAVWWSGREGIVATVVAAFLPTALILRHLRGTRAFFAHLAAALGCVAGTALLGGALGGVLGALVVGVAADLALAAPRLALTVAAPLPVFFAGAFFVHAAVGVVAYAAAVLAVAAARDLLGRPS